MKVNFLIRIPERTFYLFSLLFVFMLSCDGTEELQDVYPTTYFKKTPAEIEQIEIGYLNRNIYIRSSVNDYGFTDLSDGLNPPIPPDQGEISEQEGIDIINEFVKNNTLETGIYAPETLTFAQASNDTAYDGDMLWHFKSANQEKNSIEVLNTQILFHLRNSNVTMCYGNWYPEIYVPQEFNYSQEQAKAQLNGMTVVHSTIAGEEYSVTITTQDVENSSIALKIVPVEYETKIELHVCWQITIPSPVYYKFYVDVITGEIIGQKPTIVS